jgi:hypothetical protein
VIALESYGAFAVLQCRVHEVWARFLGSSMKDDLRYTTTDCFETFPFPRDYDAMPSLAAAGNAYDLFRREVMRARVAGLTTTYNRFHDPNESDSETSTLRELHSAMDRAVLDAYGWTDIQPTCEFLLDYEEEEESDASGGRKKKKPWRYRWPDDVRDEVLARLLELNAQRAKEQADIPPAGKGAPTMPNKNPRGRGKAKTPTPAGQGGLFGEESE